MCRETNPDSCSHTTILKNNLELLILRGLCLLSSLLSEAVHRQLGECFFWLSGVGRGLWWSVFLAVNLWSGCSRSGWLRTMVKRYSMEHGCSRAVCSNTSSRNMTSKTVGFITASCHKTQGSFLFVFVYQN